MLMMDIGPLICYVCKPELFVDKYNNYVKHSSYFNAGGGQCKHWDQQCLKSDIVLKNNCFYDLIFSLLPFMVGQHTHCPFRDKPFMVGQHTHCPFRDEPLMVGQHSHCPFWCKPHNFLWFIDFVEFPSPFHDLICISATIYIG